MMPPAKVGGLQERMSHEMILSEGVAWGDGECRLLEFKADSAEELSALVARARQKKWFIWVPAQRLRDGRWGCVLEKGMPDSDYFEEALALAECEDDTAFTPGGFTCSQE